MQSYTSDNTEFTKWFERDRANVRLDDKETGQTIIDLWDTEVQEFLDDGFYTSRAGWHQSLVEYANEHKLIPIQEVR